MARWGIRARDCDTGLNLLYSLEKTVWKDSSLSVFNVREVLDVAVAGIMEDQRRCNGLCSAKSFLYYFSINYTKYFAQYAMWVAEYLVDYYTTGKVVIEGGEKRQFEEVAVTQDELKVLLEELESVQEPEHDVYQAWFEDRSDEEANAWLAHVQTVYQELKKHI